ncbi:MAG: RHS repeat protein, partial [Hyphomicrobiales bacterium]|nr:RHS repeat protein [Hyphomicrobiales bacterium]
MDTTWALTDAETGTTWNFRSTFGSLSKFHTSTNPADPDDKRFAQLTSIVYRGGYTQTFTTDSYGAPSQIVDSYGRKLTITWNYYTPPPVGDPSGCTNYCAVVPVSIKEIGLPTGAKLTYAYESYPGVASAFSGAFVARMTSAKLLNSAGTALKSETYVYENLQYPEHLTGIVDANGGRYSTFAYDAEGRAISTEHAGGVDKYTIAYDPPDNLPNLTRTVTNPLGKQAVYTWNADNFRRRFIGITGQPSASCPGSARSYTYDEWFITSETDEEGRLTTYQRNARGLPTSITRGSGTPLATTTTIQWHASLNMPTSIATDRLTTTQTVNSKGLVSQIQQIDTTSQTVPYSTNGQTRTWAFAYNAYGKLTSV